MIAQYLNKSISIGTLRPEALIPRFRDLCLTIDEDLLDPSEQLSIESLEKSKFKEEYADQERADEILTGLFNKLDSIAPDGYRFGAHEGDGADFGFWEIL